MQPARAVRIARALWISWAVIVWNVVFDHVIVVAGRDYLRAAGAAPVSGPFPRMDDWMQPAAARAFWIASGAALAILVVGLALISARSVRISARASQSV